MKRGWPRVGWLLTLAGCTSLLGGCVERRFVITTDPPGAIVYDEKGLPSGAAPADKPFTYYGKYRFTLVRDGCETLVVEENVRPPWYEWPILDFFSENLIPFTLRDVRYFPYVLQPRQNVPPEAVLEQAEGLRSRGLAIGTQHPQATGPVTSALPGAP